MTSQTELIAPLESGWQRALAGESAHFQNVRDELTRRRDAGEQVLPAPELVLRGFRQPFEAVKVLILGQDPYPTPGHAIGMSFAVDPEVRPLPRSLSNIFTELESDLGIPRSPHGDLSDWTTQGVLLLNRVLTVTAGAPASHRGIGWEQITEAALSALVDRGTPLVSILWGADARKLAPLLDRGEHTAVLTSPHPSPLSARRGFFGSRPFSQANEALSRLGGEPVDWRLNPAEQAEQAGQAGHAGP
ncbi:uracil-DNA glycosylase [Nesterenkonia sandarakina]|uniref:Uracil-DNA glycosylase n=1 Tax=Nesterenkonia sandarakina TaxID=272918 RepID=A0A7Z0J2M9_9MICC|nr:uracil-DNA glycosylase [Nesterenkonia sandarakina]NYJ16071.1 uracil-DNA glycosylase [Nesterenkonia sandarakina]